MSDDTTGSRGATREERGILAGDSWAGVSSYVNEDGFLLTRIDFPGMIADLGKGGLLGILSLFTGLVVGSARALGNVADAIYDGIYGFYNTILTTPAAYMDAAVQAAATEIDAFGIVALPAGVAVVIVTFGGVALVWSVLGLGGD